MIGISVSRLDFGFQTHFYGPPERDGEFDTKGPAVERTPGSQPGQLDLFVFPIQMNPERGPALPGDSPIPGIAGERNWEIEGVQNELPLMGQRRSSDHGYEPTVNRTQVNANPRL